MKAVEENNGNVGSTAKATRKVHRKASVENQGGHQVLSGTENGQSREAVICRWWGRGGQEPIC
jgi:hypothetical protein